MNMKKILSSLAVAGLLLTGCDSYLDVNQNPNYPMSVSNDLVLPSAENFITAKLGESLFNAGGFFAQYWDQAVEANQYNDLAEYNILQTAFNAPYRDLMAGGLTDLKVVIDQATVTESWGDVLAATVLRAYTYQILADALGDIPYSEALQGSTIPMPAWEAGTDVYAGLITEIDNVLAKVQTGDVISTDLILDGNLNDWITFANVMKLKLYMRESNFDENGVKNEVMALINNGKLNLTSDIMMGVYTDDSERRNPWFECNWSGSGLSTINNIASSPIIDYLVDTNDPRISSLFTKSVNGDAWKGLLPGNKTFVTTKTKDYSFPLMTATTPVYLVTVSEVQFFIAEAQLRWGTDAAAKTAYEAAVSANFDLHGVSGASAFISNFAPWDGATTAAEKIALIGKQKWVALCMVNHWEAWSEARRLDSPTLLLPVVNDLNGKLVKRFLYPELARNFNDKTPDEVDADVNVWWDMN